MEDKNPDQFPKTKKIAKGMYSYFLSTLIAENTNLDFLAWRFYNRLSLNHLDNFVLKELKTDVSSIRKQGRDLFIPLFHNIGRTHSNFQITVAKIWLSIWEGIYLY
mgnify:CR=1 FL=1